MRPEDFFETYKADAQAAQKATGIPASVTLAQAGLESAYGIDVFQFNFFGIKADASWKGKTQLLRTTEVLPFADIPSLTAHYGKNPFPEVISIEPIQDRQGWYLWKVRDNFRAYDSAEDGFTDHANFFIVTQRLIAVIRQYNLTQYDVV